MREASTWPMVRVLFFAQGGAPERDWEGEGHDDSMGERARGLYQTQGGYQEVRQKKRGKSNTNKGAGGKRDGAWRPKGLDWTEVPTGLGKRDHEVWLVAKKQNRERCGPTELHASGAGATSKVEVGQGDGAPQPDGSRCWFWSKG